PKFWTAEEKKTRKIDRLARSLLIQGIPNDIYSLIDSNKTAKDLWDALERQMRGSEYAEQDRKAAILYEYETFKATEGENKQKEKVVVSLDSEGSSADDFSELKKITALLAKAFNRRSDSDQEINAFMVFVAQIEKVFSDSDESFSSAEETIAEQTSSLKPYVPNVILEKIIIDLEDEVVSLLEKEKANLETIESLKLKGFESSENAIFEIENQSENDCQVVDKECDDVENPKVIAPEMLKLSVSQSVPLISMSKTSCDSKNVENKTKRKRCNQKQLDDFDFWTNTYATDDDELHTEKVSHELVEEISKTVDVAELRKVINEILRQRCTSGDEHQYHIDPMQNFLKNDIVQESRKGILSLPFPQKPTSVIQSCQRYPKAPALSIKI
nr:integrase, catalytic region, zinc finger, CCHC-type, peptidase aspartic, catalytic [Tanacetum cinerariifolium]